MAHLPRDELPSEFDVVVDGTGLVQSILAAALARAGKTVLHLDRNAYYGELWGSLMHRELQQWMVECRSHDQETTPPASHDPPYTPCEGEEVLDIDRTPAPSSVTSLVELIHTEEDGTKETAEDSGNVKSESATGDGSASGECCATSAVGEDGEGVATGEGGASGDGDAMGEANVSGEGAGGEGGTADSERLTAVEAPPTIQQSSKITWQSLEPEWRRFNFDLLPKFLYCRGAMVDVITESSCSRYIEFRAVSGIYNYNGLIEQVPCSRSDVFSSKAVTMMEKRKMMKFLTFCADFQNHPEEYQDDASLPFKDYLSRKQLTPNLVQYIQYCIAMTSETATTLEGLQAIQVFINSLGRYGNAPFLFPIFGGGELPQAFCRLCAVYGGVYCLQSHVTSIVSSTTQDNNITSVICSSGQQIKCSSVVLSAVFLATTHSFRDAVKTVRLSRGMFVTDSPLPGTDGKLSVVTLAPGSLGDTQTITIRVLQLDHQSNSCPSGTFMIHMQCSSVCETAQQDLQPAARALFNIHNDSDSASSSPRLLWSLYYNLNLHSIDQSQTATLECPRGLYMTSEPDTTIGYEKAASEAREIFDRMCPGAEFLPHPPNPDDIILEASAENNDNGEEEVIKGEAPNNETPPTDKQAPETPPTDNQAPETPPTDNQAPETPPTDNQAPETPPTDKQAPETPPTDNQAPETPPTDKQAPETPPTDTQDPEILPTNSEATPTSEKQELN